jgi:hypothetical protein
MANSVRIDKAKLEAAVSAMSQKAVMKGADAYRGRVRHEIAASGRVRTGAMMENIAVRPLPPSKGIARAVVVPQAEHFVYQERGTGGSQAKPGGVLRFMPKGASVFVFAKRVRGVSAGNFLAKARLKMKIEDFA